MPRKSAWEEAKKVRKGSGSSTSKRSLERKSEELESRTVNEE